MYVNHTYDEDLEKLVEVDGFWIGRTSPLRRKSGTWICECTGEDAIWIKDPDPLEEFAQTTPRLWVG